MRSLAALLAAAALAFAPAVRADELSSLLSTGPLVRIETDPSGKFKEGLAIADVDAPADVVFAVLTDFPTYATWMPRMKSCEVTKDGADSLLDIKLDTPLVSTRYTNRATVDAANRVVKVRQEKGDLKGSRYHWRVVPLGENRARIYYGGVVRNFSSLAEGLEDDQQTITIGINVVSLMAAIKAVKVRAETVARTQVAKSG
jgi:hypothetical protein